ncbi:MAG: NYN domain-containing protein, partial [Bdellovibrionales bacterium]|nr:NYN domain-containing protein [Bdellovibrionales bacterium]
FPPYLGGSLFLGVKDICHRHLTTKKKLDQNEQQENLYRIFYYDCYPLNFRIHHPLTKKLIDFSKTTEHRFRQEFFKELKKKRKVALRLGHLVTYKDWKIPAYHLKDLLKQNFGNLTEGHITLDIVQKGTDIKIGIDIASLALKKQVDRIILISGDSDFVPAAKLARREGIDFILDPLWQRISPSLYEHIDGLRSVIKKPD